MESFRLLRISGPENPQALMADNVRPTKPLNRRTVRTNINFVSDPLIYTERITSNSTDTITQWLILL